MKRALVLLVVTGCVGGVSSTTGSSSSSGGSSSSSTGGLNISTHLVSSTMANSSSETGTPGGECTFNADCVSSERCECDEQTGCFCHPGTRGTGRNGLDACTSGNDCVTSLCVEGPAATGMSFCSAPCGDDGDCTDQLPKCSDVFGLGRICIRAPE